MLKQDSQPVVTKAGNLSACRAVSRREACRAGRILGGADHAACFPAPVHTLAALVPIPHARY